MIDDTHIVYAVHRGNTFMGVYQLPDEARKRCEDAIAPTPLFWSESECENYYANHHNGQAQDGEIFWVVPMVMNSFTICT